MSQTQKSMTIYKVLGFYYRQTLALKME
jgi:hypothetical protein